jgi:hypothetical protein
MYTHTHTHTHTHTLTNTVGWEKREMLGDGGREKERQKNTCELGKNL